MRVSSRSKSGGSETSPYFTTGSSTHTGLALAGDYSVPRRSSRLRNLVVSGTPSIVPSGEGVNGIATTQKRSSSTSAKKQNPVGTASSSQAKAAKARKSAKLTTRKTAAAARQSSSESTGVTKVVANAKRPKDESSQEAALAGSTKKTRGRKVTSVSATAKKETVAKEKAKAKKKVVKKEDEKIAREQSTAKRRRTEGEVHEDLVTRSSDSGSKRAKLEDIIQETKESSSKKKSKKPSDMSMTAAEASALAKAQSEARTPVHVIVDSPEDTDSPRKKKPSKTFKIPKGLEHIMGVMLEIRKIRDLPVDYTGCAILGDESAPLEVWRFHILVALMLSSQTKDPVVGEAMRNLKAHGLTVENIRKTPAAKLNSLISKVGFHNNKTKYLKQAVDILHEDHDDCTPDNLADTLKLPGVGPKMAFIYLATAHHKTLGIGVDTHMHRILNQLNWVKTNGPEATRVQLEAWLPHTHWGHINVTLVGLGQLVQTRKWEAIERALDTSQPAMALALIKRFGVPIDYRNKETNETMMEHIAATMCQGADGSGEENEEGIQHYRGRDGELTTQQEEEADAVTRCLHLKRAGAAWKLAQEIARSRDLHHFADMLEK